MEIFPENMIHCHDDITIVEYLKFLHNTQPKYIHILIS